MMMMSTWSGVSLLHKILIFTGCFNTLYSRCNHPIISNTKQLMQQSSLHFFLFFFWVLSTDSLTTPFLPGILWLLLLHSSSITIFISITKEHSFQLFFFLFVLVIVLYIVIVRLVEHNVAVVVAVRVLVATKTRTSTDVGVNGSLWLLVTLRYYLFNFRLLNRRRRTLICCWSVQFFRNTNQH